MFAPPTVLHDTFFFVILGLTQGAPPSSVLFLLYINDIVDFCPKRTMATVQTEEMEIGDEITLTVDDVLIHTRGWPELQCWLDACSRWAYKKGMRWESSKCFGIFGSQDEIERDKLRFYISGGETEKITKATYLGMTMMCRGLTIEVNVERGTSALTRTRMIASATGLGTDHPMSCTSYVLQMYLLEKPVHL